MAFCNFTPYATGLSAVVAENLDASGVSNPVTAVLLNFRAYDTLLEIAVLLLALIGIWSLEIRPSVREATPDPVLDLLTRFLTPLLLLVSAYLLWVGAHAPGGAFQAGSVLGAAGVLLILAGWRLPLSLAGLPLRITLVAGVSTFIVVAVLTMLGGAQLLAFPPSQASLIFLCSNNGDTLHCSDPCRPVFGFASRPFGKNMSIAILYALVGIGLFCLGVYALMIHAHLLRKILALNIMGSGVFMVLLALAGRTEITPDPVPAAMVITGIVVAVSATALALALMLKINAITGRSELNDAEEK